MNYKTIILPIPFAEIHNFPNELSKHFTNSNSVSIKMVSHGQTGKNFLSKVLKIRENNIQDRLLLTEKYIENIMLNFPTINKELLLKDIYADIYSITYFDEESIIRILGCAIREFALKQHSNTSDDEGFYIRIPRLFEALSYLLDQLGKSDKALELEELLIKYGHYNVNYGGNDII